jgi:hypothetical protein
LVLSNCCATNVQKGEDECGVQATVSILSLAGTALVGVVVSYIGRKKDAIIQQT